MTRFWFAPESPRPLALLRIGLAVVLVADMLGHWPFVVESYSTAGRPMPPFAVVPGSVAGELLEGVVPPIPRPIVAVGMAGLLVFALVCVGLGFLTRLALVTSFVLLLWLSLLDFPHTLTKFTAIGLHLLVLLVFTESHAVWSLDARLLGPRNGVRLSPAWPRRLMQLLVCHVYLGAAITKWRLHFATGDTLAFSLIDDRWAGGWLGPTAGAHLAANVRWLVVASFATFTFELVFPLLVWFRRTRRSALLAAIVFHLGLSAFLSLRVFTPLMLVALFAFLEERDLAALGRLLPLAGPRELDMKSSERSLGRLAVVTACWLVAAALAVGGGVAAQRASDPYGVFGTGSAVVLDRLSGDEIETLLTAESVPAAARVHRVDVGRRSNEWQVFGSGTRFRPGDELHVLVQFVRERPPLGVDVVLVDPNDEPLDNRAGLVPPVATRWRAAFRLPADAEPGIWSIEVFVGGELVERRTFEIAGDR